MCDFHFIVKGPASSGSIFQGYHGYCENRFCLSSTHLFSATFTDVQRRHCHRHRRNKTCVLESGCKDLSSAPNLFLVKSVFSSSPHLDKLVVTQESREPISAQTLGAFLSLVPDKKLKCLELRVTHVSFEPYLGSIFVDALRKHAVTKHLSHSVIDCGDLSFTEKCSFTRMASALEKMYGRGFRECPSRPGRFLRQNELQGEQVSFSWNTGSGTPEYAASVVQSSNCALRTTRCSTAEAASMITKLGSSLKEFHTSRMTVNGASSLAPLALALRQNTRLQILDLRRAPLLPRDVDPFLTLLAKHNSTLVELNVSFDYLSSNEILKRKWDRIQLLLRLNKYGRKKNASLSFFIKTLISAKNDTPAVFFYLSANPHLLIKAVG